MMGGEVEYKNDTLLITQDHSIWALDVGCLDQRFKTDRMQDGECMLYELATRLAKRNGYFRVYQRIPEADSHSFVLISQCILPAVCQTCGAWHAERKCGGDTPFERVRKALDVRA